MPTISSNEGRFAGFSIQVLCISANLGSERHIIVLKKSITLAALEHASVQCVQAQE